MGGYLSKIKIGRPNLEEIFEKMREEVTGSGEKHVAVLTCGPSRMVDEVFKKSQKFSKPFYPKVSSNKNTQNGQNKLESVIKGKEFEIKITDKKQVKNKKYQVHFHFHSETFEF